MPSLYVTEPGAMVEREAGQLLVSKRGEILFSAPATRVDQIVLVGPAGVTTPALHLLLERGIGLVLLTTGGAFRGRLAGDLSGHVALRHRQHQRADDAAFALGVARAAVAGKLANARALCLRWDAENDDPLTARVAAELEEAITAAAGASSIPALMGIEGRAAKRYFAVVRARLGPEWPFPPRRRRPPPDPVNALLSLLYTLLHESCYAALEAVGLDPGCGLLHQPRHGRAALALDLMEEFRPLLADLVMMRIVKLRRLTQADFTPGPEGGIVLSREGWRVVAEEYGRRLQTPVQLPGRARAVSYQKVLEVQARKLRKVIEGELPAYEPFRAR